MPLSFIIPPLSQYRARQTPPQETARSKPDSNKIVSLPVVSAGRRHRLAAAAVGQAILLIRRGNLEAAFKMAQHAATDARELVCAFPRRPKDESKVTYRDTHTRAVYTLLHIAKAAGQKGEREMAGHVFLAARKASFYLSPLYNLCEAKIAYHEGRPFRPDPAFPLAEDKGLGI